MTRNQGLSVLRNQVLGEGGTAKVNDDGTGLRCSDTCVLNRPINKLKI